MLDFTLGIAGLLVIAAYSRKREYAADAGSAAYLGKQTMIASLQKLQVISR
ncbi:M48 family metalloprotease [Patescibacteria group bacterium]|nr:M48 family metalloprotease [Patescibacteria group bacterium]MBP7842363.1 M48 family metalloprotease [Patescibacteria group bacterium]